jgi:hypothetical protein
MVSLTRYYTRDIFVNTTHYKANRAECTTTLRGSNPTLYTPVKGLRSIISHRRTFVLRGLSGSTDFFVGLGRFVFRVLTRSG